MATSPVTPPSPRFPRKVVIGLIVGWVIIVIKCAFAPYLMARWHVPIDPGWVIMPTLLLAALVSWLVITHDWAHDSA